MGAFTPVVCIFSSSFISFFIFSQLRIPLSQGFRNAPEAKEHTESTKMEGNGREGKGGDGREGKGMEEEDIVVIQGKKGKGEWDE